MDPQDGTISSTLTDTLLNTPTDPTNEEREDIEISPMDTGETSTSQSNPVHAERKESPSSTYNNPDMLDESSSENVGESMECSNVSVTSATDLQSNDSPEEVKQPSKRRKCFGESEETECQNEFVGAESPGTEEPRETPESGIAIDDEIMMNQMLEAEGEEVYDSSDSDRYVVRPRHGVPGWHDPDDPPRKRSRQPPENLETLQISNPEGELAVGVWLKKNHPVNESRQDSKESELSGLPETDSTGTPREQIADDVRHPVEQWLGPSCSTSQSASNSEGQQRDNENVSIPSVNPSQKPEEEEESSSSDDGSDCGCNDYSDYRYIEFCSECETRLPLPKKNKRVIQCVLCGHVANAMTIPGIQWECPKSARQWRAGKPPKKCIKWKKLHIVTMLDNKVCPKCSHEGMLLMSFERNWAQEDQEPTRLCCPRCPFQKKVD